MTDPQSTQTPKRPTTKVIAAVTAAHDRPSTVPRYVVGGAFLVVALGLFVLHVLTHAGHADPMEFRAILGCGVVGLLLIPGIPEALAVGAQSVGGVLVTLWRQVRGAP